MSPYWRTVIRPFLEALEASVIIEIGAAAGRMTIKLLEFAAEREAVVHVIDPAPNFDVDAFSKRYGDSMRFHRAQSHDVLEGIGPASAVLIDGDHNWYTVFGEFKRLESASKGSAQGFPMVMLHDVAWPYARRDLYYDPEKIPERWRHPWARDGIVWGQSRLSETEGINHGLANAVEEGTPRNGVLTAVEDFIEETDIPLQLQTLPGHHGLGLVASSDLLGANPTVRGLWQHLQTPEFLGDQARRLAETAAKAKIESGELKRQLRGARSDLDAANRELEDARARLADADPQA